METKESGGAARELVALERERLALEAEKLALERERLAAKEEELAALQESFGTPEEREAQFGPRGLAVAALAGIALGALVGFAAGWDAGLSRSPAPRKVTVSRAFLSMMNRVSAVHRWARDDEAPDAPWIPARRTEFPENLVIVR